MQGDQPRRGAQPRDAAPDRWLRPPAPPGAGRVPRAQRRRRRAHRRHAGARRPGRRRDHRRRRRGPGGRAGGRHRRDRRRSTPWSGIAERWQSARIGEGLILDLRRAVFGHVQRMPVAFFTRTRTGALVSRLNNDVIGAQRAFTWTLSGVVSNVIALVLALAVMLRLSWQITLLALVLLPMFVIPARRMGVRLAHLEREAADHNSAMTTQMTERFSAPGATLVKLFGRPAREEAEFGARAERVAADRRAHGDGPVRVPDRAGAGVGAGAGARLRPRRLPGRARPARAGHGRDAGPAARPALRAADRAGQRPGRRDDRARQLRAGVRGARPRAADRREARRDGGARRPGRRSSSTTCASPTRRPTRCRWPRSRRSATLDTARRRRGAARRVVPGRARAGRRAGRDRRAAASRRSPRSCPRLYDVDAARCGSAASTSAT